MLDPHRESMAEVLSPTREQLWPRNRLVGATNLLYYVLALLAGIWFVFYLASYQQQLVTYLPILLGGLLATIIISVVSMGFAILSGLLGAMARLSRWPFVNWLAIGFVEVVRGTPLLVQLLLWYYGIGSILGQMGFDPHRLAFEFMTVLQSNSLVPTIFNGYFYGTLALSVNYAAYLTEVFRTGILSIDKGQREAALSLGLDNSQTMRYVILPQALRVTIPPLTNNFITLIQDSAFLAVISVIELEYLTIGLALPQPTADRKMFVFVLGALLYLLLCYPLARWTRYLERKMAVAY